jgi:hypothetical protein
MIQVYAVDGELARNPPSFVKSSREKEPKSRALPDDTEGWIL